MARSLTLLFVLLAVSGCSTPLTAVIVDFSPYKAVIASNKEQDDEQGTIFKQAQDACNLSEGDSVPAPVSVSCASKSSLPVTTYTPHYDAYGNMIGYRGYTSSHPYCDTYYHLFVCRDKTAPGPDS